MSRQNLKPSPPEKVKNHLVVCSLLKVPDREPGIIDIRQRFLLSRQLD